MMQRWLRLGLLVGAIVSPQMCAPALTAQEEPHAQSEPWRMQASRVGLNEAAVERLARDRVLVTPERFKQVFTPYVDSRVSVFITSDSLLNTFHVLFEESFLQLETIQASRLKSVLAALRETLAGVDVKLTGDKALIAAAKRRATILIAVARALLGDVPEGLSDEAAKIVRAEAERITAAKGIGKPAWLGKPDPGFRAIDYGRFKVRGFYTRTPSLQRYFRAVAWLQAIPLRVHDDEELLTALMLGSAAGRLLWTGNRDADDHLEALLETYNGIVGTGDDWDLGAANALASAYGNCILELEVGPESMAKERARALELAHGKGVGPLIDDQIRWPLPRNPAVDRVGYRVLSAHRTPDGLLFQRTTDPRDPKLLGRTLPTGLEIGALLGSGVARAELAGSPRVLAIIDETGSLLEGHSLLVDYLRCLQALVDAPEPDAPAFLSAEPWQVKQLNTALAGWAQMRHTFVLQAKQSFTAFCGDRLQVGFVEPEPEFFGRFARFVTRTKARLLKAGAIGVFATETSDPEGHTGFEWRIDLGRTWDVLRDLCLRLEILAHKQLREVPFNEDERDFILGYGRRIAHLQFHFSNSYKLPRDDAPRIADVHSDPVGGESLLVGVTRPRALWVLYPWRGQDVLCRGAVMPYRECRNAIRLADPEWMQRLDSGEPPAAPAWFAPLVVGPAPRK